MLYFKCLNCEKDGKVNGRVSHKTHNLKYCSTKCSGDHRSKLIYNKHYQRFLNGEVVRRDWIYKFLVDRDGNKCYRCGITEWMNEPIRLWVDHIDGNASNSQPDNFRLVCPNCDCQSETFGSKNRGNGRKSKGLPMYG